MKFSNEIFHALHIKSIRPSILGGIFIKFTFSSKEILIDIKLLVWLRILKVNRSFILRSALMTLIIVLFRKQRNASFICITQTYINIVLISKEKQYYWNISVKSEHGVKGIF